MRKALKEWAVVVEALGRGDQVLLARKGGIDEGPEGFQVSSDPFYLFPTRFHQQKDLVLPHAASGNTSWTELDANPSRVPIRYWCEVVSTSQLHHIQEIANLRGQHIWRDECLIRRMTSGKENALHILVVRVFRLPNPVTIPLLQEYGGCRSWIELKNPVETEGSVPLLTDSEFHGKREAFLKAVA